MYAPGKTKLLVISPPGQNARVPGQLFQVGGMTIMETSDEKLLSIGISSNMKEIHSTKILNIYAKKNY